MSMNRLIKGALWMFCIIAVVTIAIWGYNYQISSASSDANSNLNKPQQDAATELPATTPIPVEMSEEYQALLSQMQELQQQLNQSTQTETSSTEVPTVPTLVTPSLELEEIEVVGEGVHSSDLVLNGITEEGYTFTYVIYEADLDTVGFEDVVVDIWDGLEVVRNTEGIICRIFGRDGAGKARSAKQAVSDETIQGFFSEAGILEKTREGWNNGNGVAIAQIVDVRIVKLEGEDFCRLVIAGGKKTTSGGSSTPDVTEKPQEPTATPKPDATPTQAPTATPRIPDTDIDQGLEDWWNGNAPVATPRIPENDASQDLESWWQEGQRGNDNKTNNDNAVATPSIGGNSATATPSIGSTTSNTTSDDLDAWFAGESTTSHNEEVQAIPSIGATPSIGGGSSSSDIDWGWDD